MKTHQTRTTPTHDRTRSKSSRKSLEGVKTTSFAIANVEKKNFAKSTFSSNNKSVGKAINVQPIETTQYSYHLPQNQTFHSGVEYFEEGMSQIPSSISLLSKNKREVNSTLQIIPERLLPNTSRTSKRVVTPTDMNSRFRGQKNRQSMSPTSFKRGVKSPPKVKSPLKKNKTVKQVEEHYQNLINNIKENYQARIRQITSTVSNIHKQIEQDQIISAMKQDTASQEFISLRIKQIAEQGLALEKQQQIQQLMQQNSKISIQLTQCNQQIKSLTNEMSQNAEYSQKTFHELHNQLALQIQSKQESQRDVAKVESQRRSNEALFSAKFQEQKLKHEKQINHLKQSIGNYDCELNLYKKMVGDLEFKFKALQMQREELVRENQSFAQDSALCKEGFKRMRAQIDPLQSYNSQMSVQLEQKRSEIEEIQDQCQKLENEKKQLLEKFSKFGEQMQQKQKNALVVEKQKYKKKKQEIKKRYADGKNQISKAEIEKAEIKRFNDQLELTVKKLQDDIKRVHMEWERKCDQVQVESERREAEIEATFAIQKQQLQNEYQILFEEKLSELKHRQEAERIQSEQIESQNYISKTVHQSEIDKTILQQSKQAQIEKEQIKKSFQDEREKILKELSEERDKQIKKYRDQLQTVSRMHQEEMQKNSETECLIQRITKRIIKQTDRNKTTLAELNQEQSTILSIPPLKFELKGEIRQYESIEFSMRELQTISSTSLTLLEQVSQKLKRAERRAAEHKASLNQAKNTSLELTNQIGQEMKNQIEHIRSQLKQKENQKQLLEDQLQDIEKQKNSYKAKLSFSENQKEELLRKMAQIQSIRRQEKIMFQNKLFKLKQEIRNKMRVSINSLRDDMQQIRLEVKSSITSNSGNSIQGKSMQNIIREIIRKYNELMNKQENNHQIELQRFRERLTKQQRTLMEEKEMEFSNHQKTLKKTLDTQKEVLRAELFEEKDSLKIHYEEKIQNLQDLKYQTELKFQQQVKQLGMKNQEFQRLQQKLSSVQMECSRLKAEYTEGKYEKDKRQKNQLIALQKQMEQIHRKSVQEMKKMEGQIYTMHLSFKQELSFEKERLNEEWEERVEKIKKKGSESLKMVELELKDMAQELSLERKKNKDMRVENGKAIEDLKQSIKELKEDNSNKQQVSSDFKYNKLQIIRVSQQSSEQNRSELKDIQIQMQIKQTEWQHNLREVKQLNLKKSKQIEQLHSLIAKQYKKKNSMKQNIMLASQLGSQAKVLYERIHLNPIKNN